MDEDSNARVEVFAAKRHFFRRPKLRLGRLSRKARIILIGLVVAGLVPTSIYGYNYYSQNIKSYISVGDVTVTKKHYNSLMAQAKDSLWTNQNATDQLIAIEINIQAAKKAGITVAESDLPKVLIARFGLSDAAKANEWQRLNATDAVISKKIMLMKSGGYRGAIFLFPFSRNFDVSNLYDAGPDFLKPNAITADKEYANQKAKEYHEKLVSKQLNSGQIVEAIKKDTRLILGSSGNKSREFEYDISGLDITDSSSANFDGRDYISQLKLMKPGEVSPIQTQKVVLSYYPPNEVPAPKEVLYYFIYLEKANVAKPTVDSDIQNFRKTIEVVRHDK